MHLVVDRLSVTRNVPDKQEDATIKGLESKGSMNTIGQTSGGTWKLLKVRTHDLRGSVRGIFSRA